MHQMLLPGFPVGAIRVGALVSILKKDGYITYFVGSDNYFSHLEDDDESARFAIATLIANGHMRLCDVDASELGIPRRTIQHWLKRLADRGAGSFYTTRRQRGGAVMTTEVTATCARLPADGLKVSVVARKMGVVESTLRKAIRRGDVVAEKSSDQSVSVRVAEESTTKSQRGRQDADVATGMGTACTRADERVAATLGILHGAKARYECCRDVIMGGVLTGLPALCGNGLLSGLGRHLSLPKGFYGAMHILITLGFMALGRIRRPAGLRHIPPGEPGKTVGLDRAPEARTMRAKIGWMAEHGEPAAWMKELARTWMEADPQEAGYLYVDGRRAGLSRLGHAFAAAVCLA